MHCAILREEDRGFCPGQNCGPAMSWEHYSASAVRPHFLMLSYSSLLLCIGAPAPPAATRPLTKTHQHYSTFSLQTVHKRTITPKLFTAINTNTNKISISLTLILSENSVRLVEFYSQNLTGKTNLDLFLFFSAPFTTEVLTSILPTNK